MIREASILISYRHLAQLRAIADLEQAGPAENVLELILAQYFEKRPEIDDLVKRERDAKLNVRKEWKAEWGKEQ